MRTEKAQIVHHRMKSVQETIQFGKRLGQALTGGEVLALTGDLGTGKTLLTRGIALGLEIPMEQVSSPTFTLIQEYTGLCPLAHVDFYRVENLSEIFSLGLEEYFTSNTIVIIEWAERFPEILPSDHLSICLEYSETEEYRLLTMKGEGPKSRGIVNTFQVKPDCEIEHRPDHRCGPKEGERNELVP